MASMTGKRAFLEVLKGEGVDTLFGNPGTTELPLMDALAVEPGIRYILGLQEGVVVSMADGYAQASGRLAVVNTHVAPGLGNAMGMLYNAKKAASPMLITAGQHEQSFTATEPILWDDLPTMARPLVKWSSEINRIQDLPRLLRRAAKTALALPTGPVFLSVPGDVLNAEADLDLGHPTRVASRIRGDRTAIEEAAKLLTAAKKPVIMAGDAVIQSGAHAELIALAELIGAPVYAESVSNTSSFPSTHPQFQGPLGRLAPQIRQTLDQFDLVLSVGGDMFTLSLPSDVDPMPPGMPIIHIDLDPWELGKNYPEKVSIFADPKVTLPEITACLLESLTPAQQKRAAERAAGTREAIAGNLAKLKDKARKLMDRSPMQPLALNLAVAEALPDDAIVVEEALSSLTGLRQFLRSVDHQSFFGLRGGGIGWGIAAAVGIKLAVPKRPVVGMIGDGSSLYTIQALWSAARYKLGVVFVILNNGAYRILKQRAHNLKGHAAQTGQYVGMDLGDPAIDFVGLAKSFGVEGVRAKTTAEVTAAVRRGIKSGLPLLIDAQMDPNLWDA